MLIEIFCPKLLVSNVILTFLDHLKPKIFKDMQEVRDYQEVDLNR